MIKEAMDRVTPNLMLAASQKLLGLQRGEEEPDDRDSLSNQQFFGPEDFFRERIERDAGGIAKKILWNSTNRGKLASVGSGALTPQLRSVILNSGLGMPLEEINPLDYLDQQYRVTRLGDGGISSTDAIPDESRAVHPSQFGFIDPVRGPECFDAQTEVFTASGWTPWADVTEDTLFAVQLTNGVFFEPAHRLIVEEYYGPMYGVDTEQVSYLVTPGHRVIFSDVGEVDTREELAEHVHGGNFYLHGVDQNDQTEPYEVHPDDHYIRIYGGTVYCATVPGGLLFVRRNGKAGIWSGNSEKLGVDTRVTLGTYKGSDGNIYSDFIDVRTGENRKVSAREAADKILAFPGEMAKPGNKIRAMVRGKLEYVDKREVDYELPHASEMFNTHVNMIPMHSATQGNRMLTGAKMQIQAMALRDREAPLVQSATKHGDISFEALVGRRMGAVFPEQPGLVTKVNKNGVTVKHADGSVKEYELYHNMPLNRKSVTGDTRIVYRRGGVVYVTDIERYAWEDGDEARSVDPVTCKSCWRRITGVARFKCDKPVVQVTTRSGRQVSVTEDHSLVTLKDGEVVPMLPADSEGKYVPIAGLYDGSDKGEGGVNVDVAEVVGLYLSEGHISLSQPNTLHISSADPAHIEHILNSLNRVAEGRAAYVNRTNTSITIPRLSEWLLENCGRLSHGLHLPAGCLSWSREAREALIGGYMGGDGCLHPDTNGCLQLYAFSTSERLRDELVALLASLGVFCTKSVRKLSLTRKEWRDAYGFRVSNLDVDKLTKWFCFKDRQQKLDELKASSTRRRLVDVVPSPSKPLRREVYAAVDKKLRSRLMKQAVCGHFSKRDIAEVPGRMGAWARSDVLWDLVTDVSPIPYEGVVYDLCVEGTETFSLSDGWVIHNSYLTNLATVKAGDQVDPSRPIATSNYTDADGTASIGRNLRVAFMPYAGVNFEDATVISESAAKALSSEHMYTPSLDMEEGLNVGYKHFTAFHPKKYDKRQLENIDPETGTVKVGAKITKDDPIILAVGKARSKLEGQWGELSKTSGRDNLDRSVTWEHDFEGEVTDVVQTPKGVTVAVRSFVPVQEGDKLSNRFGGKGVVGRIIPDDQMPRDAQGRPFELLQSPLTVPTRLNPAQVLELALAKVARKTGKAYKMPQFMDESFVDFATKELRKNGLSDTEAVFDPVENRNIPDVLAGEQYFMRLHHTAEAKASSRALEGYSSEDLPTKGGKHGAKQIANLALNALLSHNARDVIADTRLIRGQRNDDFWRRFKLGEPLPSPTVPTVYKKLQAYMKGAGINIKKVRDKEHLLAMTDKDVDGLGATEIKKADTVDGKTMQPVAGGLFDRSATGGHGGTKWSFVRLEEPLPNPVMEEPIRRLLGLTQKKYEAVIRGDEALHDQIGGKAIEAALQRIKVDDAIEGARAEIKGGSASKRDNAVKKLRYLETMKRFGMKPQDMIITKVPVVPPVFRPISSLGNGTKVAADANYLYQDLIENNDALREMSKELGRENSKDERWNTYKSYKAVTGVGDPVHPKLQEKGIGGLLKHVFGKGSPKHGLFQRRVIGMPIDLSARSAVTPNPSLDMDQVGLPEDQAWEIYSPFVIRRLVRRGVQATKAVEMIENRDRSALAELQAEMEHRPLIVSRAPTLHKYGIMAFRPQLIKGKTLQASPVIAGGFGLDFDGDTMSYSVPVTEKAVTEAKQKMLPSANLLNASRFDVHYMPTNEYQLGLYQASTRTSKKAPQTFKSKKDVIDAYRRGELRVGDPVVVMEG
jgi:hypothetical protein